MRYHTLLCTLLFPLGALAQTASEPSDPTLASEVVTEGDAAKEPATAESPTTPTESPSQDAASSLQISDQDFLLLPDDSSAADSENVLSGEVLTTEETFIEPMEFEDAPPPSIDPRTLAASSEAEERRLKIRYKQARLKAEKDPSLTALLDKAQSATTFEAERAAYRAYYRDLFRLMRKLDSSIAKQCDLMERTYLNKLAQTRIEPTIPLEPPPKPDLLAN
jgi:hypothetical protein